MNSFIYVEEYDPSRNYHNDNNRVLSYDELVYQLYLVLKKRELRERLRLFLLQREIRKITCEK
jgi:hypothetical protein